MTITESTHVVIEGSPEIAGKAGGSDLEELFSSDFVAFCHEKMEKEGILFRETTKTRQREPGDHILPKHDGLLHSTVEISNPFCCEEDLPFSDLQVFKVTNVQSSRRDWLRIIGRSTLFYKKESTVGSLYVIGLEEGLAIDDTSNKDAVKKMLSRAYGQIVRVESLPVPSLVYPLPDTTDSNLLFRNVV